MADMDTLYHNLTCIHIMYITHYPPDDRLEMSYGSLYYLLCLFSRKILLFCVLVVSGPSSHSFSFSLAHFGHNCTNMPTYRHTWTLGHLFVVAHFVGLSRLGEDGWHTRKKRRKPSAELRGMEQKKKESVSLRSVQCPTTHSHPNNHSSTPPLHHFTTHPLTH